jgi:hypothetical protein
VSGAGRSSAAGTAGHLVAPALPGSAHDLTAAGRHGFTEEGSVEAMTFAGKAYQGAGGPVRTLFKRHRHRRPKLSARQKAVNRAHTCIRARGECAVPTLKTWKLLFKLCCSRSRETTIMQAILVLHHVENPDQSRLRNAHCG